MGQGTVIIILAAMLTGAVLLFSAQSKTVAAGDKLSEYHRDSFGREIATYALEQTMRKLVAYPDDWDTLQTAAGQNRFDTTGTYRHGTFTVDVPHTDYFKPDTSRGNASKLITDPERVRVIASATFEDIDYQVEAWYEKGWNSIGLPPEWRYAIISDITLTLNGSPTIRVTDLSLSANIHANGELDEQGSPVNSFVEGYGTYTGGYDSGNVTFAPPIDNDDDPDNNVYHQDEIPIPPVDITPYASTADAICTTQCLQGVNGLAALHQSLTGTPLPVGVGTASNPYVLYVDVASSDELSIQGSNHLHLPDSSTAYVVIAVKDVVTFSSNALLTPTAAVPPPSDSEPSVIRTWVDTHLPNGRVTMSLEVEGVKIQGKGPNAKEVSITFNGGESVVSHLYSNGSVTFNGGGNDTNLIGGITTKDDITLNGGVTVWYSEVAQEIVTPGSIYWVPQGVRLIAYSEWADALLP